MPIPILDTQNIEQLKAQFEAWMSGARSRARGLPLQEMPHPTRTAKGDAWENGWEVIDQELNDSKALGR